VYIGPFWLFLGENSQFSYITNFFTNRNDSICPQILINAELYGHVLAPRLEKGYPSNLGGQFATQKCSKLAPSFLALTPSVGLTVVSCLNLVGPNPKPTKFVFLKNWQLFSEKMRIYCHRKIAFINF
jgi:hypothetical protein